MNEDIEQEQASFNMAVDTLRRLGEILREIKLISTDSELSNERKQETKINLVKQFFIQSTPLLDSVCSISLTRERRVCLVT